MTKAIERFTKTSQAEIKALIGGRTALTKATFNGEKAFHQETPDFNLLDPWSKFKRQQIRAAGSLPGKKLEFGSGDGRNFREIGFNGEQVIGVEKEEWRNAAAWTNLVHYDRRPADKVELWTGDAVDYLKMVKEKGDRVTGTVIACLPQSPEGLNTADAYDKSPNLAPYRADWDTSGLTLNAAVLDHLRQVSDREVRAMVIVSDRVLPRDQEALFAKTGWRIIKRARTKDPIQQDPDTGVSYVAKYDDGERFWEKANGIFRPLDAVTAEIRRQESMSSHKERADLNVYHDLTEFVIEPR